MGEILETEFQQPLTFHKEIFPNACLPKVFFNFDGVNRNLQVKSNFRVELHKEEETAWLKNQYIDFQLGDGGI